MFIFAHPDDIEFGCAGTAAKWAKAGSEVTYVLITDGNVGSHDVEYDREKLAQTRRREQDAAAKIAGVQRVVYLGYHDGLLEPTLELRRDLVKLIRQYKPNAVVSGDPRAFFPSDDYINHPDHRAAAIAAIEAVFPACEMRLLYPEFEAEGITPHKVNHVYVSFGPDADVYVDITDTITTKIEALRQHTSQFGEWDPSEMVSNWAKETGKQVGLPFAETFRRLTLNPETV
ncbi:MAG: PIG-L family deacetylase [Chloroflexi bacterium]|nr:PIG-L family deacetylase [Chloroflexota bacterium]